MSIREPVEGERLYLGGIDYIHEGTIWWMEDHTTGSRTGTTPEAMELHAKAIDWEKQRKIAQMPGTRRTAVNALAATLEKAQSGRIKSVYIGIQWDDDTFVGDWSNMPRSTLCTHAVLAQAIAAKEIDEGN